MQRISHWAAWVGIGLTVAFAGLNWSSLMAPTVLNLLVAQVNAPMGVVLLGLSALLAALFLMSSLYSRVDTLMEGRRLSKELQTVRDQADKAEASRFAQMQQAMVIEFRALNERISRLEPRHAAEDCLSKQP